MIESNNKSSSLFHIVYISHKTDSLSDKDLKDIESVANKRNGRHGVSGLLLHNNDRFMQFLEGPKDQVELIFSSIKKDCRHHSIEILKNESIIKCQFTGWHMKLATTEDIETNSGIIYHKLFDVDNDSIDSIDFAMSSMNLLQNFKRIYSQSHI